MNVTVTQLDNGLRIVTDPMATVETVSVGAWVEVGTRHETPELNGVSHFLEHMAFKGTARRSAQDIVEEIEDVGGHLNAYTARENTAYFAKVLKNDVALAVDIIADILQNASLDEEELDRERAVILQEIHQAHDTPDDIIFDHFQETAFPEQPIGWPVLGSAELVGSMARESIASYMHEKYAPGRIVLAASGRVEHEDFVALVKQGFGALEGVSNGTVAPAIYRGGDFRAPRDLEQAHLVLGFEGVAFDDPDYYPMAVLSTVLGGGMSSRLFQEIREKRGLVYSIYSFSSSYADGGIFGIYAGTGGTELEELVPLVCTELLKSGEKVREDELARARAQIKSGILMSMESTSSRVEQAARQLQVYGRAIPPEEIVEQIDAVDADAVTAVARRLAGSMPTVAAVGPISDLASYGAIETLLK
jgi:predicted Zn-dependent peptidase